MNKLVNIFSRFILIVSNIVTIDLIKVFKSHPGLKSIEGIKIRKKITQSGTKQAQRATEKYSVQSCVSY